MIEIDNATLDTIIEAKKNNKLAFFIGAGFSKNSETDLKKIPLWSDLIHDLKKNLGVETETDYLKIAQLYYLQYGEYQYFNKLKKYFDVDLKPSRVHEKLFDILPSLIVTTNWDNLLEQTSFNEGLTYDVITNDIDLVKSRYFHKIIKMHGDFQHHNIVFKEDDYLKYSDEFPLIENYIKSILSTYVVVFIGYSYSDVDLKLITKWIETKSEVTPPKFLFSTKFNNAEANYLRNHGIQLLVPHNTENYSMSKVLIQFLEMISQKDELNRYKKIIEKEDLSQDEKYLLLSFFYNKIKVLDELDAIFPKQIIDFFSEIRIKYHNNCYGLYFVTDIVDIGTVGLIKKYYKRIEKIIKNNKGQDNIVMDILKKIFYIFVKANIVFLQFNYKDNPENIIDIREYLDENKLMDNREYLDFKTKGEANDLIISEDYELLSIFSRNRIRENIRDKLYIKLAINSFNNDISNLNLKLNFNKNEGDDSTLGSIHNNENYYVKKFKDYFEFYDLTNKVEYSFINDFLNFKVIDNIYFSVSERINKNLKMLDSFINGGGSFDLEENSADLLIKSYLDFIYKNNIVMDDYYKVKSVFSLYIDFKIKFIIKFHSNKNKIDNLDRKIRVSKKLTQEDLYILLNFSNRSEILSILNSLMETLNENEDIKITDFFEDDFSLIYYFNNCFNNLLCKSKSHIIESKLSNLILLSALIDWGDGENLVDLLSDIVDKYQSYSVIDNIGLFIYFNSVYYTSGGIDFNVLLDIFLKKIMNYNIDTNLFVILEHSNIENLFLYMAKSKSYDNDFIIGEFLYFIESPTNQALRKLFILNLLPLLLSVTIIDYENIIYDYIFELLSKEIDELKFEFFILCLIYVDDFVIKLRPDILNKYLKEFKNTIEKSYLFNNYKLDAIVIKLAKRSGKEYKVFKKIKKNLNLSEN
ncbi:SIR2 family protein [Acinetobacter seifertii]|uniref:SIR2 family protein n=1 Tax=Acinetobacter seifertii TaxID=1530123 RepID=UPI0014192868|nr:SIR2 family protein [Acinetobacter seifertii]